MCGGTRQDVAKRAAEGKPEKTAPGKLLNECSQSNDGGSREWAEG